MDMESGMQPPKLLASTGDFYCCNVSETARREKGLKSHVTPINDTGPSEPEATEPKEENTESNYFKSAQWSPDGTCLLTTSADNKIRTFVLPPDLLNLDKDNNPHNLKPYHTHTCPEPITTLTPYPHFKLSNPQTALYLTTYRDHPITLHSALYPTPTPLSTYTLINALTETYLNASSLIFDPTGHSFITGTDCLISIFDVSRNGSGPIMGIPTIPSKRHKLKGGGVGMRGIVSALALEGEEGMVAAGTWSRWVGLYDISSSSPTITNFSLPSPSSTSPPPNEILGLGISQIHYSPCSTYLLVTERNSKGMLIYDIRKTKQLLGWLEGREADETNQRLGVDVCVGEEGKSGFEVWGGGRDGLVRVWEGVGSVEGGMGVGWEWRVGDDPVSSTIVHPSRTVVATSSGQRKRVGDEGSWVGSDSDAESDSENDADSAGNNIAKGGKTGTPIVADNSIKVWGL